MKLVPKRYIPSFLTRKDRKLVKKELVKSRRLYKKGLYYTRKTVTSFPSKKSDHVLRAEKIYKINKVVPSRALSKKTGCSIKAL
jgi:hypothetical protein